MSATSLVQTDYAFIRSNGQQREKKHMQTLIHIIGDPILNQE